MRISSALLFLLIAACGQPSDDGLIAAEDAQRKAADDDGRIICALAGSGDYARVCRLDRVAGSQGLELTVRHPDGGFHRLLVTNDGRGVIAADGAETATVSIAGAREIEVAIGGDRYRLPATVKGQ